MEQEEYQARTKVRKIVAYLRQAILKGEIAPGEWLRQDELAEAFGVSPTPVREAFRHLEAEGLVEHIPHRGVRAVAYDLSVARDYYELRALVEPYAVRRAARLLDEEGMAELEALLAMASERLEREDMVGLTEANWQFNECLVRLCDSRLVQDVVSFVKRSFLLDTLLLLPDQATAAYEEHCAILEALKAGDERAAAARMRENIENAHKAMLARLPTLGKRSDRFSPPDFS